jgi:hypothetical protein
MQTSAPLASMTTSTALGPRAGMPRTVCSSVVARREKSSRASSAAGGGGRKMSVAAYDSAKSRRS